MTDLITAACPAVHKLIINSGGANVTEWCKQEACWNRIKGSDLDLPQRWKRRVAAMARQQGRKRERGRGGH